ncbi:TetR/AcrR family transcriptional regulator [Bradyrhizobium sp. dw_78]|uniref:TetR/AcrR family transcriptional regulator n=1 Tax=Bradyrhizobium sp. dw_78 TaxID=2719793 RepID=UPI001BD4CAD7|nr:TetR/AcrR family transcriptional regulator [Bradyrhizobium sp. dw_78]
MSSEPIFSLRERNRKLARDLVLDAAERLLAADDTGDFSMRSLAAEAGVGFATPFNHFGSKNAIVRALSTRVIERMAEQFRIQSPRGDAIDRVRAMARIAVALLLEQPKVYRTVIGALGTADAAPSAVSDHSRALWQQALAEYDGLSGDGLETAKQSLAEQLAFMFRGCLSFWIAGEVRDEDLQAKVDAAVATVLLGYAAEARRKKLHAVIRKSPMSGT